MSRLIAATPYVSWCVCRAASTTLSSSWRSGCTSASSYERSGGGAGAVGFGAFLSSFFFSKGLSLPGARGAGGVGRATAPAAAAAPAESSHETAAAPRAPSAAAAATSAGTGSAAPSGRTRATRIPHDAAASSSLTIRSDLSAPSPKAAMKRSQPHIAIGRSAPLAHTSAAFAPPFSFAPLSGGPSASATTLEYMAGTKRAWRDSARSKPPAPA